MSGGFEQLVDLGGLGPEEVSRLRRVHDLLVAVGPPADLPAALSRPPAGLATDLDLDRGRLLAFAPRRRKPAAMLLLAAAVAAACFGGGYVLANQAHKSAVHVVRVVSLKGQQNSFASLASASVSVGSVDANGNWPIELAVSGLPQPENTRYYLMLWQNGKPTSLCGIFRVGKNGVTKVEFNVPYKITKNTRWVVTQMAPGLHYPGHVVMTTA